MQVALLPHQEVPLQGYLGLNLMDILELNLVDILEFLNSQWLDLVDILASLLVYSMKCLGLDLVGRLVVALLVNLSLGSWVQHWDILKDTQENLGLNLVDIQDYY